MISRIKVKASIIFRFLIITSATLNFHLSYGQFDCKKPFTSEIPSTAIIDYDSNENYQKYLSIFNDNKIHAENSEIILKSFLDDKSSILGQIQLSKKFIKENGWRYIGLKDSVIRYKEYIKKNPLGTLGHITEDEFKAVYLYSQLLYSPINILTRNYPLKDLPPNVIEFINSLNSALDKLPPITRPMVLKRALRTIDKKVLDKIQNADTFNFNQFLSTTFCGESWRGEIYFNILISHGSKAKDISLLSDRLYENEALFPLGTHFKLVNKYFDTQMKAMTFTIEEIGLSH